jgi:endogenous inhibitor of DNA gyrase (YacG/DUF329 family)
MKNIIKDLKEKYASHYLKYIPKDLEKEIIQNTNFLPENSPLKQRIFYIMNDLTTNPKCKTCGKEFILTNELREYCSSKCSNSNTSKKSKSIDTNLKKYGVENPAQCKEIKEKIKETNLKKYGVESYSNTQEFKDKFKQTSLERYGVDSYSKTEEFKEKFEKTNLERYGVEYPFRLKEFQEKYKQTHIEKYGVESYTQTDEYKEKVKKTNLEKYGVTHYTKSNEYKEKFKDIKLNSRIELLKDTDIEIIDFKDDIFTYKCKKCGNIWENSYSYLYPVCRKCHPWTHSRFETEVADYIKSLGIENIITNDREVIKPLELDIYLPDFNLAIECNGLYWHKEDIKGKDYHQRKTNLCKERDIQLIHIWEDWWINKKEIIQSIINNKLGLNTIKIYGRDTEIKELENKESKIFLEENHIQGAINSSVNIGLYYNNELVSLITFGKSRYDKEYDWELLRFCNKRYTNVIGGASKLFNYFSNNYLNNKTIISYALMDISNGTLYSNLGFTLKGTTQPNYFYVKDLQRESRLKYQKHKLKDILEKYDENLSEKENMFLNRYLRVYDSGSLIFTKGV